MNIPMINGYCIEYDEEENLWHVTSPGGNSIDSDEPHETREAAEAWAKDAEPYGAGKDPYGRPDPQTHPEYWTE